MFCISEHGLVGLVYVFSCLSVFVITPCFGQTVQYFEFPCYSRSDESGALGRRNSSGTLCFISSSSSKRRPRRASFMGPNKMEVGGC